MQAPDAGDGLDVDLLGRQYNNAAGARDKEKTSAGVLYLDEPSHKLGGAREPTETRRRARRAPLTGPRRRQRSPLSTSSGRLARECRSHERSRSSQAHAAHPQRNSGMRTGRMTRGSYQRGRDEKSEKSENQEHSA